MSDGTLIREFRTARFHVVVDALPENDMDWSWDEDGSQQVAVDLGLLIVFCARARCFLDGHELASDYLGGCVYESLAEFARAGDYFSDMVACVCAQARARLRKMNTVRVRG